MEKLNKLLRQYAQAIRNDDGAAFSYADEIRKLFDESETSVGWVWISPTGHISYFTKEFDGKFDQVSQGWQVRPVKFGDSSIKLDPQAAPLTMTLKEDVSHKGESLGWRVRELRAQDGTLHDCFVEAPAEGDMPYGIEVLGDDYTGFGGVERKYEHCKMIVEWANNAAKKVGQDQSIGVECLARIRKLMVRLGISTNESIEGFGAELEDNLNRLVRAANTYLDKVSHEKS